MAIPIAETPILTGKDAENFENEINNVKTLDKDEINKIRESYILLKKCNKE